MRNIAKLASVFVLLSSIVSFGSQARAGLLIEPYVGYGGGTFLATPTGQRENKINLMGTTFGARIGFTVPFFFMALDYGMMNGKADGYGSVGDATIQNQLYAVLGLKLPFIRAYAGYAPLNTFKVQSSSGDDTFKGTAIKGGIGFTGIPFLSLNLEYIMNTYTHGAGPGYDQDIPGTLMSKATSDAVVFTVSLPFDI